MPTQDVKRRVAGIMLRATREAAGVSRETVADECGVSVSAVGHWEVGRSTPARSHLKVWAELCEVPLADLYGILGLSDDPISFPRYWLERHAHDDAPAPTGGATEGNTSRGPRETAPAQDIPLRRGGAGRRRNGRSLPSTPTHRRRTA